MSFVRTLAACLIALSVALLPATFGVGQAMASADMSMSTAMDDCCPNPETPCDKTMKDCAFMAACVLKNVGFSATAFSEAAYPLTAGDMVPLPASAVLHSQSGSPPLHPPQA
jgi:hypothetical protein